MALHIQSAKRFGWGLLAAAVLLTGVLSGPAKAEPRKYEIDPEHFSVGFLVDHIGFNKVLGMFLKAKGSFTFDETTKTLSDGKVVIDASSVFTNLESRDDHLRSPDFLNVEEFPEIVFTLNSAEKTGERTGKLRGDVEILGKKQPVVLDVTWNKSGEYPFGGGFLTPHPWVLGASIRGTLERSKYGMTYGIKQGWVGDDIELLIEFEARRQ